MVSAECRVLMLRIESAALVSCEWHAQVATFSQHLAMSKQKS
jgi:hypothetical protein